MTSSTRLASLPRQSWALQTSLWFYWPMLGTGLGVLVIGVVMGGLGGLFGAGWERRQVKKYLERRSGRLVRDVAAPDSGDLSCAIAPPG